MLDYYVKYYLLLLFKFLIENIVLHIMFHKLARNLLTLIVINNE